MKGTRAWKCYNLQLNLRGTVYDSVAELSTLTTLHSQESVCRLRHHYTNSLGISGSTGIHWSVSLEENWMVARSERPLYEFNLEEYNVKNTTWRDIFHCVQETIHWKCPHLWESQNWLLVVCGSEVRLSSLLLQPQCASWWQIGMEHCEHHNWQGKTEVLNIVLRNSSHVVLSGCSTPSVLLFNDQQQDLCLLMTSSHISTKQAGLPVAL
jgi:hypothetical protein